MSFAPTPTNGIPEEAAKEAVIREAKQLGSQAAQQGIAKAAALAAENEAAAKAAAKAQQAAAVAQSLDRPGSGPASAAAMAGNNGGINPNANANPASYTSQPPANQQPTASQVAAAMLPVMVGYEIFIDGNKIAPIAAIAITQAHGAHHHLSLHFGHELVQPEGTFTIEDAQDLLGKPALVTIKNLNNPGAPRLEAKFIIADVALDQQDLDEGMLHLTGYSPTWLLDGAPHYETFTGKNLKDIATAVATKPLAQFNSNLKANPTLSATLPFVCRYNESGWNFLKRLAGETGQWLYFDGADLIFGKTASEQPVKLIYGKDCYHLQFSMKAAPVQTGVFDYHAAQDNPIQEKAQSPSADAGAYAGAAFKQSKFLFSAPAHSTPLALGGEKSVVEAIGKARADSRAAGLYTMKGESTLFELHAGSLIDVEFKRRGQSASHGQMRIVSVSHQLSGDGHYSNTFEAIPAGAGAPPLSYYVPATHPMLAKVIDNNDPHGQGRIKAEFIGWGGEGKQTDWLRVLTPDAGGGGDKVAKNRGLVTVPEKNDQVYVDFENGNPDKPFVTGSVFHGKHGSGGGTSNNSKSLTSKSGHTIHLDDGGGITIKDRAGNVVAVDGSGNITATSSATNATDVGKGAAKMKLDSGGNISLQANAKIELKVGGSTLTITPDTIALNTTNNTVTGSNNIITGINHITGGNTTVDGGDVFIN
jgi:type VI secretion system secreted protein VgrG